MKLADKIQRIIKKSFKFGKSSLLQYSKNQTVRSLLLVSLFMSVALFLHNNNHILGSVSYDHTEQATTSANLGKLNNTANINDKNKSATTEKTTSSNSSTNTNPPKQNTNTNEATPNNYPHDSTRHLVATPSALYIGGTNPTSNYLTVRADDGSKFNYISTGYYNGITIGADTNYGPEDMPSALHEVSVTQSDLNSSGKYTVNISAYGVNGLYTGSFDVVFYKALHFYPEKGSVIRTDGIDTITYTYNINITEALMPNNATVSVYIPTSATMCTNTSSLKRNYTYKGYTNYSVECIVKRYVPPPPCTSYPCYVAPLRSEGNISIGIEAFDNNGNSIYNTCNHTYFDFVVSSDYDR